MRQCYLELWFIMTIINARQIDFFTKINIYFSIDWILAPKLKFFSFENDNFLKSWTNFFKFEFSRQKLGLYFRANIGENPNFQKFEFFASNWKNFSKPKKNNFIFFNSLNFNAEIKVFPFFQVWILAPKIGIEFSS